MPNTVQIIGTAPNSRHITTVPGAERWCFNAIRSYGLNCSQAQTTWTRWFNLHSKAHILKTYPESWDLWKASGKPIYLQQADPDIPTSLTFPREGLQIHFSDDFFTCSCAWLLAYAAYKKFRRIELWGIEAKYGDEWKSQRPCIAYWIGRARQAGIDVFLPEGVDICHTGILYGYGTT